jgi:hypothetical protein
VTLDGVLDWILGLLTTLTHNSLLHLIIAPSLISTLYSSLEHTLSLPASSVFTSSFLVTASNEDYSSASVLTSSLNGVSLPTVYSCQSQRVTLRLAAYRQSVCLGARPLETHDHRFIFQLNSCGNSPYVTSSLTRGWACLLWICLAFRQVYV